MYTKAILIRSLLMSISLGLISCSGGGGGGSGDGGHLSLRIAHSQDGQEGGNPAIFEVRLNRANDTGSAIRGTVRLGTTGSATGGYATDRDITATTTQYEIPVNSRTARISVGINDDDLFENNETLTATLDGTPTGVSISHAQASVLITDNDNTPGSITTSLTVLQHGRENSTPPRPIIFMATLSKANHTGGPISLIMQTDITARPHLLYQDTAENGIDYSDTTGVLTIAANGAKTGTFSVRVLNDPFFENATETVTWVISDPSDPAITDTLSIATAEIYDGPNEGQFKFLLNVGGLPYTITSTNTISTPTVETGTTSASGHFSFDDGESVTFTVAGVTLGRTIFADKIITPLHLIPGASFEQNRSILDEVLRITRFLSLLDIDGDVHNGIFISPATVNALKTITGPLPADFFTNETVFTQTISTTIQPKLDAITPTETHTLTNQIDADLDLKNALKCIYSGIFQGRYRFNHDLNDRIGILNDMHHISAIAYSEEYGINYYFTETNTIDGALSLSYYPEFENVVDNSQTATLSGIFENPDVIDVEIEVPDPNMLVPAFGFPFDAYRLGGDWDAKYRISALLRENPIELGHDPTATQIKRGLLDLQIDASDKVTGSIYWIGGANESWQETPVTAGTYTYTGSTGNTGSLTVTFADGTFIWEPSVNFTAPAGGKFYGFFNWRDKDGNWVLYTRPSVADPNTIQRDRRRGHMSGQACQLNLN